MSSRPTHRTDIWAALAALALLLAACGKPAAPVVAVVESPLGAYNALPAFAWSVADPSGVEAAAFAIDSQESWTPLSSAAGTFRPDVPLQPGTHTLYLRVDGRGGWSEVASVEFTVTELASWTPDDTYYADQWALPMVDMPLAWGALQTIFTDRDPVVVAVIDTGYTEHPDLLDNLMVADGYDFISDVYTANDGNGIDPDAHDAGDDDGSGYGNSWHGTSVAGAIAGLTDNAAGTAGVGIGQVTVMPLRALGRGGGFTTDIAQAVLYAAGLTNVSGSVPTTTAKIINMSLGSAVSVYGEVVVQDVYIGDALGQATNAGVIPVAASGNASDDPSWFSVGSPASLDTTIAVGAVGDSADVAYYSQMGAQLDVVAPGGAIYDQQGNGGMLLPSADWFEDAPPPPSAFGYALLQGTSFACPMVAGVLAVLATIDPDIDLETARTLLKRSSADLTPPLMIGGLEVGILNAASVIETHFGGRFSYAGQRPAFSWARGLSVGPHGTVPAPPALSVEALESDPLGRQTLANPAYFDQGRLIVRFADGESVELMEAAGAGGVRAVTGGTANDRVLQLDSSASLPEMRELLLAEPGVEAVYYNFRYVPL